MCLYPGADPKKAVQRHAMRKIRVLYLLLACAVCTVSLYLCFYRSPVIENNRIERTQENGSSRSVDLTVSVGEEQEHVVFSIEPRRYSEKERAALMQEVKAYIRKTLPGENPDLAHVALPLHFADGYPDGHAALRHHPEGARL